MLCPYSSSVYMVCPCLLSVQIVRIFFIVQAPINACIPVCVCVCVCVRAYIRVKTLVLQLPTLSVLWLSPVQNILHRHSSPTHFTILHRIQLLLVHLVVQLRLLLPLLSSPFTVAAAAAAVIATVTTSAIVVTTTITTGTVFEDHVICWLSFF